jgi:hypothetical protein
MRPTGVVEMMANWCFPLLCAPGLSLFLSAAPWNMLHDRISGWIIL